MPRMPEVNADDHLSQDEPTDLPTSEPVETVKRRAKKAEPDTIDTVSQDIGSEAFFNEIVEIVVHESTDPSAIPIPQINVNGVNQFFIRGQPQKVKRLFLARLARMKQRRYSQQIVNDPVSGHVVQRMIPHTGLRYPFSVVEDPNPKGPAWLQKILSEA
jgi:hypothetical protein